MKKQKWLDRYRSVKSKKNSTRKSVFFGVFIILFSFFIIPFFVDYVFDYYVFRNWGGARLCLILFILLLCTAPLFNIAAHPGLFQNKDGSPDMRLKENKRNKSKKEASSYTKTKVILFCIIGTGIIFSIIFMHNWLFYQQRLWGKQESKEPQIDYYDEDPAGPEIVPMVLDAVDDNYVFENPELQELNLLIQSQRMQDETQQKKD